ncbi:MAG: filamentous hemagglutinin N-terminal domain-containing protein [Oscillatoria sp. Prado101]|nr:filamentous hemagglutinin N-terminal domain-containing protein [Oscillatoria sp. Prado101]
MKPPVHRLLWLAGNLALCCLIPVNSARAQIAADGTLPTSVTASHSGNFTVEAGSRAGNNLFHSFREFSVPVGGSVFFNNAPEVQNIISRVTGGNISKIDGTLRANGTANLFLLNPSGVIFGPNASLDIGGSFFASSASSLKFADGREFSATNSSSAPPLLTVSVPTGLQFGSNTGPVVNRSQATVVNSPTGQPVGLQVQSERTLALVGGEVRLEGGNLTAPGGRIELGSVGGNSSVNLNPSNRGFALSYEGVQNFRDIYLSGGAAIDVTNFSPVGGSGDVRVQGRRVTLTGGSQIASFTTGAVSSGSIAITASESVELIGTGIRRDPRGDLPVLTNLTTTTIGDGNAGDLTISTRQLIVRDGAGIFTSSVALPMQTPQGRAGNLRVMASESVEISGSVPILGVSGLSVKTRTGGDAGTLEITTGRLILRDGAQVTAATSGAGRGGILTVVASESVEVSGTGTDSKGEVLPSSLTATSASTGDAGNLTVTTGTLTVRDGAEITVSGTGTGGAGNLEVQASRLQLDSAGRLRAETAAGNRGSIRLDTGSTLLRHNSSITTEATGSASGGNITISTGTITALENSKIIASAIRGAGGNIQIDTRGIFRSADSEITASSQFGVSGTVTISNPEVNPSAGLVELPSAVQDPTKQVVVGCAANEGNSLTVTGRGGLPEDPTATVRGQTVWRDLQDFSELAQGNQNSSLTPISFSFSPLAGRRLGGEVQYPRTVQSPPNPQPQLVEATGWTIDAQGNVVLVASVPAPTAGSAPHRPPDCHTAERQGRAR